MTIPYTGILFGNSWNQNLAELVIILPKLMDVETSISKLKLQTVRCRPSQITLSLSSFPATLFPPSASETPLLCSLCLIR